MRFTTGVVVGFAIGYYLGTKADAERREQLREVAERITENEQVQAVLEATEDQRRMARSLVGGTLRLTSKGLRAAGQIGANRA
jgi:hypothetical protein